MLKTFRLMSNGVIVFFDLISLEKMSAGSSWADVKKKHSTVMLDLKVVEAARAQRRDVEFASEMFSIFSKAVSIYCNWFRGCKCHDHIWQSDKTDLQKDRQFRRENPGMSTCVWKGKRCSECARGCLRPLIRQVKTCSSPELSKPATRLAPDRRAFFFAAFENMKES